MSFDKDINVLNYIQCVVCHADLESRDDFLACSTCEQIYGYSDSSENSIPRLFPKQGSTPWVDNVLEHARICDEYIAQRIEKNDGWWLEPTNPYMAALRRYNLLCGRYLVVELATQEQPGSVIVDIGAGDGYLSDHIESVRPGSYVQLSQDISGRFQEDGKRRHPHTNVFYVTSDSEHSGLKTGVADVAISTECIEHIRYIPEYLHEIHRLLKPGGTLYITTPNKQGFALWLSERGVAYIKNAGRRLLLRSATPLGPYGRSDDDRGYEHLLKTGEIIEALEETGFRVVSVTYNQYLGELFFAVAQALRCPVSIILAMVSMARFIERLIARSPFKMLAEYIGFNQVIVAKKQHGAPPLV